MSDLKVPQGIAPGELGKRKNHVALHDLLAKYEPGKFWVTDKASEEELAQVRRIFGGSEDGGKEQGKVLFYLLADGDHEKEFRLLLSIGIHPDLWTDSGKYHLSHDTVFYERPACARALAHCRPDLAAVNNRGETPKSVPVSPSRTIAELPATHINMHHFSLDFMFEPMPVI